LNVAVVTGATGGIGRWIALGLTQAGFHVVLVARDRARGEAAQAWIAGRAPGASTALMLCDLSLLAETRALGRDIAARYPAVSILVANAGVFRARREVTAEGHEMVLAVNHLSIFVLIETLRDALVAGAPSRVVVVGSSTSDRARIDPDNLELARGWGMVRAYGQSKLAVMIASFGWARRLGPGGVAVNVVHPGTVATGLVRARGVIGLAWRVMARFVLTEEQGAATPLYVALAPELAGVRGAYFKDRREVAPNALAGDAALGERVWAATVRLAAPVDRGGNGRR
jgi:NAD(P)-dependent dehydrogenase (short-subunit alcohol dehydrogenase family)